MLSYHNRSTLPNLSALHPRPPYCTGEAFSSRNRRTGRQVMKLWDQRCIGSRDVSLRNGVLPRICDHVLSVRGAFPDDCPMEPRHAPGRRNATKMPQGACQTDEGRRPRQVAIQVTEIRMNFQPTALYQARPTAEHHRQSAPCSQGVFLHSAPDHVHPRHAAHRTMDHGMCAVLARHRG
jgi:hypothetical protein